MRDNETNSDYAGIAGYAFAIQFNGKRDFVVPSEGLTSVDAIPSFAQSIVFAADSFSELSEVDFSRFRELKELVFGANSFVNVGSLELAGLHKLERLRFEAGAFANGFNLVLNDLPSLVDLVFSAGCFTGKPSGRRLADVSGYGIRISGCSSLRRVVIPGGSFTHATVVSMVSLSAVEEVRIEEGALPKVEVMSMVEVESVTRISIAPGSLEVCETLVMMDVAIKAENVTDVLDVSKECLKELKKVTVSHVDAMIELVEDLKEKLEKEVEVEVFTPATVAPTVAPTTVAPTTVAPTTVAPTTVAPTTVAPTTVAPTTVAPTTVAPTTETPTTIAPTTVAPTTVAPTTVAPTTVTPTTMAPATVAPTTVAPPTVAPTTVAPTTVAPPTVAPTTVAPTTVAPTTVAPTTMTPTTVAPTIVAPTTVAPTIVTPTTVAPTTVAPTTVAPTIAPTTVAPTTVAPTTMTPTTIAPGSWFPIYDPYILGDNCNFEKQTTCYWDVIKDDNVTRLYLAIRNAYPTKALAHTRVLALSGMTSWSLEMWHESLSKQVKNEAPIDTYFYSDVLLSRGLDVALIPRMMELLQYTYPSRLVFVYGTYKRDGFKTMLDWMVNNANRTYFKNLKYFQVSEHNLQASIEPAQANTLEAAILADLKAICEDKVNFPLLETINLDNNSYNEYSSTGISEFAMHLMQACPVSSGVEVSASTRLGTSYTKMCGSVDDSYPYYDLEDKRERAQCRFTWNWELKSQQREYAPYGPFPNRQNMEFCDDDPVPTFTPTTPIPPIYPTPTVTVHSVDELNALDSTVESIIVDGCSDESFTVLNLTRFVNLKVFEVGDDSFANVNEVCLIGLPELERVVIGMNSFTKQKSDWPRFAYPYSDRHFNLKDCPQLRELKIGRYSFNDYSSIVIESVNSLEVIHIGAYYDWSYNFYSASKLELRNLPSLKSVLFGRESFADCSRVVFDNLSELTSIRLGKSAFYFEGYESNELIMRNMPSLTSLTTVENSFSFNRPRSVTLENMPSLTNVTLPRAFENMNVLHINNAGELINHPGIYNYYHPSIHYVSEFNALTSIVESISVDFYGCNDASFTVLNLTRFVNLKEFVVDDSSFRYVNEVHLIGLSKLERVVIGSSSFRDPWSSNPNPDRHFYLKNCPKLRELKMGTFSFYDYSLIEIENMNSLEVIEMGDLNDGNNFAGASLELRNLFSLKSILFGSSAFKDCSRVVFENLPELTSIRLGSNAFSFADNNSTELIMRNLPSLTSLTTIGDSLSFSYARIINLEDMPSLTNVTLPHAFEFRSEVQINNAGELINHPILAFYPTATVNSVDELNALDSTVESIIVDGCNDESFTVLNLTRFVNLKVFEVSDYSFYYVNEVHLIGLSKLERVVIGMNSFTKHRNTWSNDSTRHFYLKNCRYSFSDYSLIEIENVNQLEVIEMGDLNEESNNFYSASKLELKNLPKLRSLLFGSSAFKLCSSSVFENLPEMTSIRLGQNTLQFKNDQSTELIMRNMPSLTSLTTIEDSLSFQYPRSITLENMPSLTNVTLPRAFERTNVINADNAGELANHPIIYNYFHPTVHSVKEFNSLTTNVEGIIVDGCNDASFTVLNLTRFVNLKELIVGNDSLSNVNEVHLIGLSKLERVVIGMNSLTKFKNGWGNDSTRHFYLKDCPQLRELKIGRYSFSDYSTIEIENVNRLEVIEMGDLNEWSYNFAGASLELKNMPLLKSVLFGSSAFNDCSRAVFENLPELTSIQLGSSAFRFNSDNSSSELIMRNMPKLTSLTTVDYSSAFRNPLMLFSQVDMPNLTTVTLVKARAFKEKTTVHTMNITSALQYYLEYSLSLYTPIFHESKSHI
ncbi:hypothetical protein BLSTO_04018 [Blastocystis sp. subtype 1]